MDKCVRDMKAIVGGVGAGLKLNEVKWSLVANLFASDNVLLAESAKDL